MKEEDYQRAANNRKQHERKLFEQLCYSEANFPWDWYGGKPIYGMLHLYLLRIAKPYLLPHVQVFIEGNPSFGELIRFENEMCTAENDKIDLKLINIMRFCFDIYNANNPSSDSVSSKVYQFLLREGWFRGDLKHKVSKYIAQNYTNER